MGLALRKEDFDIVPPPPAIDWQRALEAVEDLKSFERTISLADDDMARWRNKIKTTLSNTFEKMELAFHDVDAHEVRDFLFPVIDEAIIALEASKRAYETPIHERPDAVNVMLKAGKIGGGPGRFLRKQINRMEDIRVKQMNAYVDLYYALLAFRSKYEDGVSDGEIFDDPDSLEAFLKSQIA